MSVSFKLYLLPQTNILSVAKLFEISNIFPGDSSFQARDFNGMQFKKASRGRGRPPLKRTKRKLTEEEGELTALSP